MYMYRNEERSQKFSLVFMFTKAQLNIVVRSKSNFSPAQVRAIVDARKNTLTKFFNTTIERLEKYQRSSLLMTKILSVIGDHKNLHDKLEK